MENKKILTKHRDAQMRRPMPSTLFNEDSDKVVRPASVTINKSIEEVWTFVRDLANMPRFVRNLKSVEIKSPKLSHWTFEKDGKTHEHDSEIIADEMQRLFAWKQLGGDETIGVVTVEEAPGGRGTMVSMRTTSDRQPGKVGGMLSYFSGRDPKSESYINLRRMKAYIETGEVPTIEGQPNGRDEDNNQRKN